MNYLVNWHNHDASCLHGMFRGGSCFLVCGGPSVADMDLSLLQRRGVLVAAVNNVAAATVRPNLWFSYDSQHCFHRNIWRDPFIMKFLREENLPRVLNIWDGEKYVTSEERPRDCPNVWGYKFQVGWNAETFLTAERPTVGTDDASMDPDTTTWHKSVLLPTLRILFDLGVRRLYLLGCDFLMTPERCYGFDETQDDSGVRRNNELFDWLNRRFWELREHFAAHKFQVFNCTPFGHLTAFERMPLAQAVDRETRAFDFTPHTRGHYR